MKLPTILSVSFTLAAAALQAGTRVETTDKSYQAPAVENLGGPYWAIYGGIDIDQTADRSDDRGDFGAFAEDIDGDTGWFAGFKVGYDFDNESWAHAAVEIEGQYTNVDVGFGLHGGGFRAESNGEMHAAHLMVNGLIRFGRWDSIRPYIGGGVGIAHIWLRGAETEVTFNGERIGRDVHQDDEEWTLAYQGIGGIDFALSENFTIFTEYKALVFHDAVGLENNLHHQVAVGARFRF